MSRKKPQVFNTYGRHRQRVVEVVDEWAKNEPRAHPRYKSLFSSFSSNDSCHDDTGSIISENKGTRKATRPRKCKTNKENVFDDTPSWISEQKPKKKTSQNESTDSSDSDMQIFKPSHRVLRDHSVNKSVAMGKLKKTANKKKTTNSSQKSDNTAARRTTRKTATTVGKNTTRSTKNNAQCSKNVRRGFHDDNSMDSIETSRHGAPPRLDFSEFEKYSLLIGSPIAENNMAATPEIESATSKKTVLSSHEEALTSTPHCTREEQVKCNLYRKMNLTEDAISDLSHVSHVTMPDDSPEFTARVTRQRNKPLLTAEESAFDCCEKLEQLSLSSFSGPNISCNESCSNRLSANHGSYKNQTDEHHSSEHRSLRKFKSSDKFGYGGSVNTSKSDQRKYLIVQQSDGGGSLFDESRIDFSNITERSYHKSHSANGSGTCNANTNYDTHNSIPNSSSRQSSDNSQDSSGSFVQKIYRAKYGNDASRIRSSSRELDPGEPLPCQSSGLSDGSGSSGATRRSLYDPSQSLFEHSHVSLPAVNNLYVTQRRNNTKHSVDINDETRYTLADSESEDEDEDEDADEEVIDDDHYSDDESEESSLEVLDDDSDLNGLDAIAEESENSEEECADISEEKEDSVCEVLEDGECLERSPTINISHDQESVTNHIDKSHDTSSEHSSYHTCPSAMFNTPQINRVLQVRDDLRNSGSLRVYLTPVKMKSSEQIPTPSAKVLTLCDQVLPITFSECIPPAMMKKCKKIGEGVYGEVFRSERNKESVALKIIPIEGSFPVNDEQQKSYAEMLPEIVISKELSALREDEKYKTENFVQVRRVSVVKGSYPDALLKQWDIFHNNKISENDRPDVFDKEQLFLVFEFNDCGCDLESVDLKDLHQAKSIIYQVTCSLALAEERLQFEHRDLHWGNVLVKTTQEDLLSYTLRGEEFQVQSKGVKVSVIDFTLSRLSKDGCNVFTDLSVDPTLFQGQGDYQFEVYRLMKDENKNQWDSHNPYTNVLWIHYLADKLLQGKKYRGRENQALRRQFRTFVRETTDYSSALHLLSNCPFFQGCMTKS